MSREFSPAFGQTVVVTNALAATAAVVLPIDCDLLVLTNTSGTATVHVYVTPYGDVSTPPAGVEPTLTNGYPVRPGAQVRVHVGRGPKLARTIASMLDGTIILTPGRGV